MHTPVCTSNQEGRGHRELALRVSATSQVLPTLVPSPANNLYSTPALLPCPCCRFPKRQIQITPLILEAFEWNSQRHELWSQADVDVNHGSATYQNCGCNESLSISES